MISEDARPREKLLACDNPKAITTEDLLAIVLGHGTKGKNVFDIKKVGLGKIILGDCLDVMQTIPDNEIILAFTSPPYLNAINYDEHVKKLDGEIGYWRRKDISYEYYKNFLIDRFKELYRIIKPGGHNVVKLCPQCL